MESEIIKSVDNRKREENSGRGKRRAKGSTKVTYIFL